VIRQTEDGDLKESPVNLPLDRLQRTVTRRLKELGVLDDPDTKQANAERDKTAVLRDMMVSADGDEGKNHGEDTPTTDNE
jgi:hypothetical protein